MAAIIGADGGAQLAIGPRAAELLDPGMLVRRHRLLGELAADPIRFLGENYALAVARRRQRRGTAAEPAADNDHVGAEFARRSSGSKRPQRPGSGTCICQEVTSVHE